MGIDPTKINEDVQAVELWARELALWGFLSKKKVTLIRPIKKCNKSKYQKYFYNFFITIKMICYN